jgi:CHRD domain
MKKLLPVAVLALVAALGVVGMTAAMPAKSMALKATMNVGQEVPKPMSAAGATGSFTATLADNGTLTWKMTFRKLTGAAGAAHIHIGRPGQAGPVAVALCGPCTSGKGGTVKVPKKYWAAVTSGRAYVNVHTAKNAGGEIRGQLRTS